MPGEKPSPDLLAILAARFAEGPERHEGINWSDVEARLTGNAAALDSLRWMEETGGEPDVIGRGASKGSFTFCDCSAESPAGRRSLCYDRVALDKRKEHKPAGSVVETAREHGVELLGEEGYARLQAIGDFDCKSASWLSTPDAVRRLGGAIFAERRFGRVFVCANGADSYFGNRGFRVSLEV